MDLPGPVARAVQPLFEALPADRAMSALVVTGPLGADLVGVVEAVLDDGALTGRGPLASALWLYIDELDRSHKVSQGIKDTTGSYWHGIMHRREGDFANSHYWFDKVGPHPAIALVGGYDPHRLIDDVEGVQRAPQAEGAQRLVDLQRREWQTLFAWCASQYGGGTSA